MKIFLLFQILCNPKQIRKVKFYGEFLKCYGCYAIFYKLKGLSSEIDFKNVDKNLQNLA
jgi:hypothetical protein